jgi:hypothetical protein
VSDFEVILKEYKTLVRSIRTVEQLTDIVAYRHTKMIKVREKGSNFYRRMRIPSLASFQEFQDLLVEKLQKQKATYVVSEVIALPGKSYCNRTSDIVQIC